MASSIEQLAANFNFGSLKKADDLKKRIWFTLLALIVYRIGTYIPLPYINTEILRQFVAQNSQGIFGILDMFSGGSVGRMTIFSLNIMPYISASIIVQLMTSISPYLMALKKEGEAGRKKLNQYTRYGTVALALVQSIGFAIGMEKISFAGESAVMEPGLLFRIITMITLTGGTMFVMWLGEQITSRGIGNGISLLIYAGIVANLPQALFKTLQLGREEVLSIFVILMIFAMIALVIAYIVFMEKAQRRILIQYPKRQVAANRPPVAQSTHLPLKLNSAGVIPPIFASTLLLLPTTLVGFMGTNQNSILGTIAQNFGHGKPIYILALTALIIFFAFFYTAIVFNPEETAENLRKSGAYVPGVRPGKSTADYFNYVLVRLTAVGSLYLASICILPELILMKISLPFYFGGTSLLIVVSVTIDTITQVQSHLIAHQYEGLIKKSKNQGRR